MNSRTHDRWKKEERRGKELSSPSFYLSNKQTRRDKKLG
jgi:hypothetical protein